MEGGPGREVGGRNNVGLDATSARRWRGDRLADGGGSNVGDEVGEEVRGKTGEDETSRLFNDADRTRAEKSKGGRIQGGDAKGGTVMGLNSETGSGAEEQKEDFGAEGLLGARELGQEVVDIGGARDAEGVGESDDDRVEPERPEEGRRRATHPHAPTEPAEGAAPSADGRANLSVNGDVQEGGNGPGGEPPPPEDEAEPRETDGLECLGLVGEEDGDPESRGPRRSATDPAADRDRRPPELS